MRCLIFYLIFFCPTANARKEFKDLQTYHKLNPHAHCDGSDGNWLTKDRKAKTMVWDTANEKNLLSHTGYEAYQTLAERAAFYDWFDQQTKKRGFTTQWAKLACNTTKRLKVLNSNFFGANSYSSPEINAFVNEGNSIIFNDCWHKLAALYRDAPITGETAKAWDEKILKYEQVLIHPYYQKLKKRSIQKLERLLKKENLCSKFLSGCEFKGSLLSVDDVCLYGMRRMGYLH